MDYEDRRMTVAIFPFSGSWADTTNWVGRWRDADDGWRLQKFFVHGQGVIYRIIIIIINEMWGRAR